MDVTKECDFGDELQAPQCGVAVTVEKIQGSKTRYRIKIREIVKRKTKVRVKGLTNRH